MGGDVIGERRKREEPRHAVDRKLSCVRVVEESRWGSGGLLTQLFHLIYASGAPANGVERLLCELTISQVTLPGSRPTVRSFPRVAVDPSKDSVRLRWIVMRGALLEEALLVMPRGRIDQ